MIEFSTMNGIRERMKKCIRESMTGELEQGSGTEPFRPMDRIQTVSQLEKCVDWIALAYDEKIAHREPTDEGYCLCMYSVPAGHEIFLIGTVYVLLCAGAEIWVNMGMEEAGHYPNLVLLAAFAKEFEQIREAEDYGDLELTLGMLRRDHRVCHVIEMGDCPNMSHNCTKYEDQKMYIHVPGAHLVVVDYSTDDLPDSEHKLLKKFGDKCMTEVIDYDCSNGNGNQNRNYYGFDYADLFWDHRSTLNEWKEFSVGHDRLTVVLFSDKGNGADLPEDVEEYAHVYRPDAAMLDFPMYDFMQLLERARPDGWFADKIEAFGLIEANPEMAAEISEQLIETYDLLLVAEILLDLKTELKALSVKLEEDLEELESSGCELGEEIRNFLDDIDEN